MKHWLSVYLYRLYVKTKCFFYFIYKLFFSDCTKLWGYQEPSPLQYKKKKKPLFASTCMRYRAGWVCGCESEKDLFIFLCIRKQERPFSSWSQINHCILLINIPVNLNLLHCLPWAGVSFHYLVSGLLCS